MVGLRLTACTPPNSSANRCNTHRPTLSNCDHSSRSPNIDNANEWDWDPGSICAVEQLEPMRKQFLRRRQTYTSSVLETYIPRSHSSLRTTSHTERVT